MTGPHRLQPVSLITHLLQKESLEFVPHWCIWFHNTYQNLQCQIQYL